MWEEYAVHLIFFHFDPLGGEQPIAPCPRDLVLRLTDCSVLAHQHLLAGVSPLLRRLLADADPEEQPCLAIPDTSVHLMSFLLRSAGARGSALHLFL